MRRLVNAHERFQRILTPITLAADSNIECRAFPGRFENRLNIRNLRRTWCLGLTTDRKLAVRIFIRIMLDLERPLLRAKQTWPGHRPMAGFEPDSEMTVAVML
jgi:hypothetical protein